MKNGVGILEYQSGAKYEGFWEDNLQHGIGKMIFSDGAIYAGYWFGGMMQGKGILIMEKELLSSRSEINDVSFVAVKHQWSFEGYFWRDKRHSSQMHEKGTITYGDGSSYYGMWLND
jgi:hypothetical protein